MQTGGIGMLLAVTDGARSSRKAMLRDSPGSIRAPGFLPPDIRNSSFKSTKSSTRPNVTDSTEYFDKMIRALVAIEQ
jgi:hypothetical protein